MEKLPAQLQQRLSSIFSQEEMSDLKNVLSLKKRPTTFRINTIKGNAQEVEAELDKNNIEYTKLSFPENCYVLDSNFSESDLWKLICYTSGRIYIQGISSQIPPHLFSQTSPSTILDATAAPGGKTSQLAALYPDAKITAFEPSKIRYDKMCHNLKKLGVSNVETIYDSIENIGKHISETEYFDMILIDAPCSSEGSLLINNSKFLENWDISHIKKNYKRQKRICDSTLPYLKVGGELIYSTCTLSPEENEAVIHYLLCNYPELELESIALENTPQLHIKKPLTSFEKHSYKKEISENCVRIIPSEYSEGFFVGRLRKKEVL